MLGLTKMETRRGEENAHGHRTEIYAVPGRKSSENQMATKGREQMNKNRLLTGHRPGSCEFIKKERRSKRGKGSQSLFPRLGTTRGGQRTRRV